MPQQLRERASTSQRCPQPSPGVHIGVVSAGAGRVQRWLVGYIERWEDDEAGYVSKNFLRAGWHLHERTDGESEHPVAGLTYTAVDSFESRVTPHPKQRSQMESARRAIARLCKEGVLEESPDRRSVRLPMVTRDDDDLTKRLAIERQYLKAHGQSASDELLVAVTGNIVVIELERRLSLDERISFKSRSAERGDSPSTQVQNLVDYVATKHGISGREVLGEAFDEARRALASWREEDR